MINCQLRSRTIGHWLKIACFNFLLYLLLNTVHVLDKYIMMGEGGGRFNNHKFARQRTNEEICVFREGINFTNLLLLTEDVCLVCDCYRVYFGYHCYRGHHGYLG
jgi:hypothetical protein